MKIPLLKSKQIALEFQSDPKKFKKYHKIKYKVIIRTTVVRNNPGLAFLQKKHSNLTIKQLLTILKLIKPGLKNYPRSRINQNFKLDTVLTKKPKDIRMGRGKGTPTEKVFSGKAGNPLFNLYNLPLLYGFRLLNSCKPKLSYTIYTSKSNW